MRAIPRRSGERGFSPHLPARIAPLLPCVLRRGGAEHLGPGPQAGRALKDGEERLGDAIESGSLHPGREQRIQTHKKWAGWRQHDAIENGYSARLRVLRKGLHCNGPRLCVVREERREKRRRGEEN